MTRYKILVQRWERKKRMEDIICGGVMWLATSYFFAHLIVWAGR